MKCFSKSSKKGRTHCLRLANFRNAPPGVCGRVAPSAPMMERQKKTKGKQMKTIKNFVKVGSCNVPESEFEKHLFGKKKEYIVTERDVWQATGAPNDGFHVRKMYGSPRSLLVGNFHVWMTAKEANEIIGCNLLD